MENIKNNESIVLGAKTDYDDLSRGNSFTNVSIMNQGEEFDLIRVMPIFNTLLPDFKFTIEVRLPGEKNVYEFAMTESLMMHRVGKIHSRRLYKITGDKMYFPDFILELMMNFKN